MGRLFGTDGIRGIAITDLTCENAMMIGRATAAVILPTLERRPKIVIGKDTRLSSDILEAALISGICSVGADAITLGVIPTPAVAHLIETYNADAGIMISASHNPMEYNGIKIFDRNGFKLSDEMEQEIESIVLENSGKIILASGECLGRLKSKPTSASDYAEYILKTIPTKPRPLKVAVDCANGSASVTAKKILDGLGLDYIIIGDKPDGTNINKNLGSTHMKTLCQLVLDNKCDLGVAFDGDADRCLAVDESGDIIDGDKIMAIFATYLKQQNKLKDNGVAITVMTNFGFYKFAEEKGIKLFTNKVGDRYVLECMQKNGLSIGGEQSGHIILSEYASTGDGQLTAAWLIHILSQSGKSMSELASVMSTSPQSLINITADRHAKEAFKDNNEIKHLINQCESELSGHGRVLVRASGTEHLIRVMVEGEDKTKVNQIARKLADTIEDKIS